MARPLLPDGASIVHGPLDDQLHHSFRCRLHNGDIAWLKLDLERFVDAGVEREAACLRELAGSTVDRVPAVLASGAAADGTPFMLTSHLVGTRLDRHLAAGLAVQWPSVVEWLAAWHRVGGLPRVHGSFDTRNILVREDGALAGVIDFEAHRKGTVDVDVASLLVDVLESSMAAGARPEAIGVGTALADAVSAGLPVSWARTSALARRRIARRRRATAISPRLAADLSAAVAVAIDGQAATVLRSVGVQTPSVVVP